MRELETEEIEQVSGGFLPIVLGGMAISGVTSYLSGDSKSVVFASTVLGGLGGGSASLAKSAASGIMRAKWTIQGSGLTIANGTISSSGNGVADITEVEEDISN